MPTSTDEIIALSAAAALFHASVCAVIALIKNRNGLLWFLIGWTAPLIGLVVIACLPSLEVRPDYRGLFRHGFRRGSASGSLDESDANAAPSREAEDKKPETDEARPRP